MRKNYFLPYQSRWLQDQSRLKIIEKSRQIGITFADAFDSVRKAADKKRGNDVWITSRDEGTARLYIEHCKRWARLLHLMAQDLGQVIIDKEKDITAHVLKFASGWSISCLSSHPDALVGKTAVSTPPKPARTSLPSSSTTTNPGAATIGRPPANSSADICFSLPRPLYGPSRQKPSPHRTILPLSR